MNRFYTAAQVTERIPGLTVRALIDMTEKGIIHPAMESTGQGSPRQYDDENLLQIAVAFALRSVLPPAALKGFMVNDFDRVREYDLLVIHIWTEKKMFQLSIDAVDFKNNSHLTYLLSPTKNPALLGYIDIILHARQLRNDLKI